MRLNISNPLKLDLSGFCPYLITILKQKASDTSNLDLKLVEQWNKYLEVVFQDIFITIPELLKIYFYNQIFYQDNNGNYIITLDRNAKIDQIPIEQIAQTIMQGTLDIKGYDIFSPIYESVAGNIEQIYSMWEAQS